MIGDSESDIKAGNAAGCKSILVANDGLAGEESFAWGQDYQFLTIKGKRGISHADMNDLNRENIPGFDVREFFVQIVEGLKRKGF